MDARLDNHLLHVVRNGHFDYFLLGTQLYLHRSHMHKSCFVAVFRQQPQRVVTEVHQQTLGDFDYFDNAAFGVGEGDFLQKLMLFEEEHLGGSDDELPASVQNLMLDGWLLHSLVGLLVHLPLVHSVAETFDVVVRATAAHRNSHVFPTVDFEIAEGGQEANRHHLQLPHVRQENASSVPVFGSAVHQIAVVLVCEQFEGVHFREEEAFGSEAQRLMLPAEPVLTYLHIVRVFFSCKNGLAVGCHPEAVEPVHVLLKRDEKSISALDLPHAQHVPSAEDNPLLLEALKSVARGLEDRFDADLHQYTI